MKVEVVPHDPSWKEKFKKEAAKIKQACGDKILTIEHGGSTAIEGLAAKPVIDIYVGVNKLEDADLMVQDMKELYYQYVTKFEDVMPFRRFFTKDLNNERAFHVHTVEASHTFRRDDLLFKDYIKENVNAKKEYEELKLNLAKQEWETGLDYNEAKTEFITKIKLAALNFFSKKAELAEAEAMFDMFRELPRHTIKECGLSSKTFGSAKAIQCTSASIFLLNRVIGLGFMDKIGKVLLDEIIEFYRETNQFSLQLAPVILNDENKTILEQNGFINKSNWVKYIRNTEPVNETKTDLTIKEIDAKKASDFAKLAVEVFKIPEMFIPQFETIVGRDKWRHFMAFDGNKTAGISSLYINGDTGWLGNAATHPDYRNRGAQGVLIAKRIDAARESGCKWVTVETAPDSPEKPNPSFRNIIRNNFRLLYFRPNYIFTG